MTELGFTYMTGVQAMSIASLRKAKATGRAKGKYNPAKWADWWITPRDLPPLSFHLIRQMLLDETVTLALEQREAPLHAVEFAYKEGENWVPGIRASSDEVADYVLKQLERIWSNYIDEIARSQVWGWSAGELILRTRDGLVEVDEIDPRRAEDSFMLTVKGRPWGVQFRRMAEATGGKVDLKFPRAIFHAHRAEPGDYYGRTVLLGCYVAWADKALAGGGRDVRRLFMIKDSYGGADLTYPTGESFVDGSPEPVPNERIAQSLVEQITAGGVTVRPSDRDENGNLKWELTRSTVSASPNHILQYPKDLDGEIRRGIGIPDDVIDSEGSGAWAGKRVPAGGFYTSIDKWANQITRELSTYNLEPLVELNFGRDAWFEVTHKPLALTLMEAQGEATGGSPGNFGIPEQLAPGMEDGDGDGRVGEEDDSSGGVRVVNGRRYRLNANGRWVLENLTGTIDAGGDVSRTGSGFGRLGLDLAESVGEGLLEASDVIDAAETLFERRRARRMSAIAAGEDPDVAEQEVAEDPKPARNGGKRGPLRMARPAGKPTPGERYTDDEGRTYEFCGDSRRWKRIREG